MKKIIFIIITIIFHTGCGCDPDCSSEWEECKGTSSDMFGTTYTCVPKLIKYNYQYSGIESLMLENSEEIFSRQRTMSFGRLDSDPPNYMRICLENYCGYSDINSRNIYVIFNDASSGNFNIPKQSEFDSIIHPNLPSSNNLLYTQVSYEGNGNIIYVNGQYVLSIDCTVEFVNESGTINYIGYSN